MLFFFWLLLLGAEAAGVRRGAAGESSSLAVLGAETPGRSSRSLFRWTGFAQLVLPPLLILLSMGCPSVSADQDAKRLYEDLLTDYNRLIRPVGNNSDRLTVKLGLKLSQLIDVVSFIENSIYMYKGEASLFISFIFIPFFFVCVCMSKFIIPIRI